MPVRLEAPLLQPRVSEDRCSDTNEPPLTRFKDWPKHEVICNKTGSTTQQPKVMDKKTVRTLFETDEGQDEVLEDVERLLDAVMPEPEDLR